MSISIEEVLKIAALARLELSEEEAKSYSQELSQILDYFKKLESLDTSDVEPTFHAVRLEPPFREDEVKEFEAIDEILANAPELHERSIVVPEVVKT